MLEMKEYIVAARIAGVSAGSVTRKNVATAPALHTRAASSRFGSIIRNAPTTSRNTVVTPRRPSRNMIPLIE